MLPQKIFSLQHPFVKHWKKLCKEKKYREYAGSIMLFGSKMVVEAATQYPIRRLLISRLPLPNIRAIESYLVSIEILKKISGMKNPERLAAEIAIPTSTPLYDKKCLLALDRVTDPGNLGTLIRSAWAFGVDGLLLLPGCVDIFNDKALRSAKGASLHMPFQYIQESDFPLFSEKKFTIYIGDMEGTDFTTVAYQSPYILLLGNEGQGVSKALLNLGEKITIPMRNSTDSLNVSIAGSLLLYQMKYSSCNTN